MRGELALGANAIPFFVGTNLYVGKLTVGYANLQLTSYGNITLAADVRVVGPLHVRVEGDLAISEPIVTGLAGYPNEGSVAALPGIGVGAAVRPTRGTIQPQAPQIDTIAPAPVHKTSPGERDNADVARTKK